MRKPAATLLALACGIGAGLPASAEDVVRSDQFGGDAGAGIVFARSVLQRGDGPVVIVNLALVFAPLTSAPPLSRPPTVRMVANSGVAESGLVTDFLDDHEWSLVGNVIKIRPIVPLFGPTTFRFVVDEIPGSDTTMEMTSPVSAPREPGAALRGYRFFAQVDSVRSVLATTTQSGIPVDVEPGFARFGGFGELAVTPAAVCTRTSDGGSCRY